MVIEGRFIDRAGVVVQTARDRQVNGEVLLGHAEGAQLLGNGRQLGKAGVKDLVFAAPCLQRVQNLGVCAANGDEAQDLVGLLLRNAAVLDQDHAYLLRADLVELVDGSHDVAGLPAQTEQGIEAVEQLAVVDADGEALEAEAAEDGIDDGRDLGLVENVELAVADDVNVGLIKLAEAAALGALTAIDLADLIAPEGEGQLVGVQRDVFGQRNGQVKAQRKITVALLEAVDLLFRLAAALGQQDLGGFQQRGVERREAVERIGLAQDLHHALELHLRRGQQLHEAG